MEVIAKGEKKRAEASQRTRLREGQGAVGEVLGGRVLRMRWACLPLEECTVLIRIQL